ncbi:dihydroneopterin aldolase [Methylophilus sp. Leaf414]|jgi:7,8-dihydroneopterin aldolase/epimerase/oxygenase|uniref:dihydroneopterin aldolase n=1 Tax=Methylophilus sp. Leaf414 TaxID=1736371 RepID=UPI0006F29E68|nr:dihydroneopterin aldolase [Methylophilus sp. Leaf414]KQT33252.1 dienelactone hydrolase [Methylophilus sp. Leaf414]
MDTIFLEQVKVQTKLGVPEWERAVPQTVILDIEIGYDFSKACQSDAIEDTIDYGQVVGRIRETLAERSFKLVEALGEHVCQLVLQEFKAQNVKLKVSKPGILPGLKALGVTLYRTA